ncbi:hypothetical protein Syun_026287 [Stephania yunnanensis]|uniref:Uncharacterized protein n=1 Tax=Stephania yunnanensis TaxID=152371 RepID=A0AAP0EYM2_9MAGN
MDSVAIEPSRTTTTLNSGALIGENHNAMLKESIDRFFVECQKGLSDFSGFLNIFFRFLQARIDPPLETVWFYSALSFRVANANANANAGAGEEQCGLRRVRRGRDLFQLLTACAATCGRVKSVAVMAPVVVELYGAAVEVKERKLVSEVEGLLDGILSYASMRGCEGSDWGSGSVGLISCFTDLVRVWTNGRSGGDCEIGENLRTFFPLASEEVCQGFVEGEFGVGHLAGVVIVEAFLLKLCLKLKSGGGSSKTDLVKELRIWAVAAITGFQNCYFFEILFRMLLDSTLPVSSLLDSEDEISLRRIIYDALILAEYSILSPEGEIQQGSYSMKYLALTGVIVVHEAIQFVRKIGDHAKAISYLDAYSRSRLRSFLIKWASKLAGMIGKATKPDVPTPQSLIKWLLKLEDQGVAEVFDGKISKFRAKLVKDFSKQDNEQLPFQLESKEEDVFYVIDNKAEEEENGQIISMDAAFLAAAHTMKIASKGGRRKRKDVQEERKGITTKTKFLREHIGDRRAKQDFLVDDKGMGSESEVENPHSSEDSDLMEE